MAKLPDNSLCEYLAMGPGKSYEALARRYGVSKRAVVKKAHREGWQDRIAEAEEAARKSTVARAAESIGALNDRHLRTVRMIEARALEALKNNPLHSGMDAIRALAIALKEERSLLGLGDANKSQEAELDEARDNIIETAPSWQRDLLEYIPNVRSLKSRKKLINQFEASRTDVPGNAVQDNDIIKAQFFKAIENAADEARIVVPLTDSAD